MYIDPFSRRMAHKTGARGLTTLMYHSVCSGTVPGDWPWAVSYQRFCDQMDFLRELGCNTLCARDIRAGAQMPPRAVCITFDDGYADNWPAFEALCERGMRASWFVVTGDVGGRSRWPGESIPPQPILSGEQLRHMEAAGMEICSHTVSHCRLTKVDDAVLDGELIHSMRDLSDILRREVTTLAYPYGLYDERVVEATRRAGYLVALTAEPGFGMIADDPLRVRRITVFNTDTLSAFSRKLALGWNDVQWRTIARQVYGHGPTVRLSKICMRGR